MAFAHKEFDATNDATGAVLTNVQARVELEGGGLVSIYSDRAGTTPLANPATFADGHVAFFAVGGAHKITLTQGAYTRVLRYVPIGLMQEADQDATKLPLDGSAPMTAPIEFVHQPSPDDPPSGRLAVFAKDDDRLYTRSSAGVEAALIGGSVGATDNAIPRADGTAGGTLQSSGVLIDDSDNMSGVARLTINKAPVFDLASAVLAVAIIVPLAASTLSVAASKQFNFMRMGQTNGGDITFAVGAGGSAVGLYSSLSADAASDAASNVYGMVAHATNYGAGTVRGIHAGGYAQTGSTGPVNAVGAQLMPLATSGFTSGLFVALNSTGVHDKAFGVAVESNNADRYAVAYGNGLGALPIGTAYFRAWMATGSSASARAFQLLNNGGSEIAYWTKAGDIVAPNLIANSESNGITISQAAISRNHVNGSMTLAAGTAAGNGFAIATGGSTRMNVLDAGVDISGRLSVTTTLGYATGAGGTVTQATSKSTGVTLSKACGQITMNNAALAAGAVVSFSLTNTAIAAGDVLVLNHVSGGTLGAYTLNARCAAGSATIDIRNNTAGSLSDAIVIGFALVKAVTA